MRLTNFVRATAALAFSAAAANAQIVGTFNGAGSLSASGSSGIGMPVTLTFTSPLIAVPTINGIFSAIPIGATGTVQNVTVGTGAFSVPNFIQIAGYTFSLSNVAAGSFSPAGCAIPVAAAGQTCSPPGTPFNLANLDNGAGGLNTSAAFNVGGTVTHGTASNPYTGIFTAQFANTSYQDLSAQIDAGGTIPVSYSLTIQAASTVPEPATIGLMASGLAALVVVARRRRADA